MKQFQKLLSLCVCLSMVSAFFLNAAENADGSIVEDKTFGELKLVDSIDCTVKKKGQIFFDYPSGSSKVEEILGQKCRVIENIHKGISFFAYRIGRKKGLKPGECYLLEIDYPQDKPRTLIIQNGGCESSRGLHTGATVGDVLKARYVNNNAESIQVPLSGKYEKYRQTFFMHNRFCSIQRQRSSGARPLTTEDGFWVVIAHFPQRNAPISSGAAASSIKLYQVMDEKKAYVSLNLPPEGLPRRHIFWREEMSDGVVGMKAKSDEERGVKKPVDWYEYKVRLMKILGIDTFCKDLLEFGHNQGWDSAKYGGNKWVNQTGMPHLWSDIVTMAGKYNMNILPYYEYRGSVGQDEKYSLGKKNLPRRLDGGKVYTQVKWCETQKVDITTKEAIKDTEKILEITIVDEKKKANFLGAWFRPRPSHNPISFTEQNFEAFSEEANDGNFVTRSQLNSDKKLLDKYYKWWFGKRKVYLDSLKDYLRKNVNPNAFILYTLDSSEPGFSIPSSVAGKGKKNPWQYKNSVVTDNVAKWKDILKSDYAEKSFIKALDAKDVVSKKMQMAALTKWKSNYGNYDWKHAAPPADPQRYKDDDGVMLSHTINRLYTVQAPETFEAFRTQAGLAVVRHYALNENEAMSEDNKQEPLGYFVADVERAGPYCMMAETVAMANGDPTLIGYLCSNNNTPGNPEYRRNFYQAFLSLPALPSNRIEGATENKDVVVREIKTEKDGTYYSVTNTSMKNAENVTLTINAKGKVYDAATGKEIAPNAENLTVTLYPYQLRSLLVK